MEGHVTSHVIIVAASCMWLLAALCDRFTHTGIIGYMCRAQWLNLFKAHLVGSTCPSYIVTTYNQ